MSAAATQTEHKNDDNHHDDDAPSASVTVHLPEKTTKKALNRLRKLGSDAIEQKLATTLKRANALTVKLVRARKELQDLETTKYHLEHPDENLFSSESKKKKRRAPADGATKKKKADGDEPPKKKPRAPKANPNKKAEAVVKDEPQVL